MRDYRSPTNFMEAQVERFGLADHSPAPLRDLCIRVIVSHTSGPNMGASPASMRRKSPSPPSKAHSPFILSRSSFSFLDSISTIPSSSLPIALIRDLEEARRFLLPSSAPSSSPRTPSFISHDFDDDLSPPTRSATSYASLPLYSEEFVSSSPPSIPMSLRQRESTSSAFEKFIAAPPPMLLMPPRRRTTELVYRVVLVGDDCVGKTSICDMWKTGKCPPSPLCECTIGAAFFQREIAVDNYTVRLEVWDAGGQARFDNLTPMYIMEADGVIAVYDVCSRDSYDKAKYWVDQALTIKRGEPLRIILAGNKSDLLPSDSELVVPHDEAEEYVNSNSEVDGWLPVSAHENVNVGSLFKNMAKCLMEAERHRLNRKILASLDIQPVKSDAISVSLRGASGPAALAPVIGLRLGFLPTLPWLHDDAASACMLCFAPFSVTRRRHHCRRCGRLACHRCSRKRVVLPSGPDSSTTPSSSPSPLSSPSSPSAKSQTKQVAARVCDHCAGVVACWTALHS